MEMCEIYLLYEMYSCPRTCVMPFAMVCSSSYNYNSLTPPRRIRDHNKLMQTFTAIITEMRTFIIMLIISIFP